ncbi:MAG: alpha/beta fold hydrolase [Plesiomonas sp.]|uniref:alpha/beta fold hydrolase n=1 Tax=Plesiomonas sp. TaxID=2486279 RepID=UPI003EE5763F
MINYKQQGQGPTLVLIHGLFGTLDNLGLLARDLVKDHHIVQVDLRNHGQSFFSDQINYRLMADDLIALLDHLNIRSATFIGHSMGGKVAMTIAQTAPDRVDQLVVLDMSPVDYQVRRHDNVFRALHAVSQAKPTRRSEAVNLMQPFLKEEGVILFLLKSFDANAESRWRFNVTALENQYANIVGWQDELPWQGPVLFVKGELSPYIQDQHREQIMRQFPAAKAHVIAGTGHWLHAEKPDAVLRAIRRFLLTDSR